MSYVLHSISGTLALTATSARLSHDVVCSSTCVSRVYSFSQQHTSTPQISVVVAHYILTAAHLLLIYPPQRDESPSWARLLWILNPGPAHMSEHAVWSSWKTLLTELSGTLLTTYHAPPCTYHAIATYLVLTILSTCSIYWIKYFMVRKNPQHKAPISRSTRQVFIMIVSSSLQSPCINLKAYYYYYLFMNIWSA